MEDYHNHKCVECGKAFVYKETLMNHMKRHHEDEESEEEGASDDDEDSGSDVEKEAISEAESDIDEENPSDVEESDGESSDETFTYDDVRAILRYHRKHSV